MIYNEIYIINRIKFCTVFFLFILILLPSNVDSLISSSLYNGFALVGSNANTKISFATLLSKANRELPYTSDNQYEILHIFSDQNKQFGTSVGLGGAKRKDGNVTIGAVTSPAEELVFIYDFENCTKSSCEAIIEFSTDIKQLTSSSNSFGKDDKASCEMGTVSVGTDFVVTACLNNLLSTKTKSSALLICLLDLDSSYNNCTDTKLWGNGTEILEYSNITCSKGQLYVTGLNAYNNQIIFTACGVCMNPEGNQISVSYFSAFVILQVDNLSITPIQFQVSFRNESCPSSISMSADWVAMGFPEEKAVDLFYYNSTNSTGFTSDSSSSSSSGDENYKYEFFKTIKEIEGNGFGNIVNIGNHLLVATASGDASQDIDSTAYFYEIFRDNDSNLPAQSGIEASIPNLNYKTPFQYGYSTSFYGDELLLISQDLTLTRMAFTFYGVCPKGQEWSSDYKNCSFCPPGQYKPISNDKINGSFELCFPCPKGYYTGNNISGIDSTQSCQIYQCNPSEFCPDGSVLPQASVPIESYSQSNPDPNSSEEMDFESTFYNSCYPYFLIILGGTLIISLAICLPWPCKKYHRLQNKIIKKMLWVNFYDWDGEDMTEVVEYLEKSLSSSNAIQINNLRASKRGIFVRKRRMAVKPVKAVESFCSYYFLIVFVLLCIFIFQFQQVNNDTSLELRPLGQASTVADPSQSFSDAQYLKLIDSSPMKVTIDLIGYTGECQSEELSLTIDGCQKPNYMGVCNYVMTNQVILNTTFSKQCRINLNIPSGVEYSDYTDITINISPSHYFYTQRIIYNVSTNNSPGNINTGNSFVTGVIQPSEGTILRPTASISILSMLTLVSDCKIRTDDNSNVGLSLVRPMIDKCLYNPSSYKDLSLISNQTSYIHSKEYHDANPNFSFTIRLEKSIFYHYATSSHSVSFGEIVTVIMFAVLDVFWLIEVIVPLIQFIVSLFEDYFKKRKENSQNDENYDEMNDLIEKDSKPTYYNALTI